MKEATYYTAFSENKVFSDFRINIFLNQLYTYLLNSLDSEDVLNNFLIDGPVALSMQGELKGKAITDFLISVSSDRIFDFLKSSISGLSLEEFIISEARVKLKVYGKVLNIDYSGVKMQRVNINGIWIRNKSEIKY